MLLRCCVKHDNFYKKKAEAPRLDFEPRAKKAAGTMCGLALPPSCSSVNSVLSCENLFNGNDTFINT